MSDTGKKIILLVVAAVMALGAGEMVLRVIGYAALLTAQLGPALAGDGGVHR